MTAHIHASVKQCQNYDKMLTNNYNTFLTHIQTSDFNGIYMLVIHICGACTQIGLRVVGPNLQFTKNYFVSVHFALA